MTDLGSSRSTVNTSRAADDSSPQPTGWVGWIVFASFMMFLLGSFQAIQGLVAIFNDDYYIVTDRLVVDLDFTVWGWTHLLLGVLIVLCGAGVLKGNVLARTVGALLAGLSAIVNLLFIEAYPVWSIVVITVDILVIYALTVHGREMRNSTL